MNLISQLENKLPYNNSALTITPHCVPSQLLLWRSFRRGVFLFNSRFCVWESPIGVNCQWRPLASSDVVFCIYIYIYQSISIYIYGRKASVEVRDLHGQLNPIRHSQTQILELKRNTPLLKDLLYKSRDQRIP